jgi:PAS domain S-box-containing protein
MSDGLKSREHQVFDINLDLLHFYDSVGRDGVLLFKDAHSEPIWWSHHWNALRKSNGSVHLFWRVILSEGSLEPLRKAIQNAEAHPELLELDVEIRMNSGNPIIMKAGIQKVDWKGPAYLVGFQVHTLHANGESARQLLQKTSRVAKVGGWEFDLIQGKIEWTDEVFRLCGRKRESFELGVENAWSIIHPEDMERATKVLEDALNKGSSYRIEKRFLKPDGSVVEIYSEAEIERDAQGNPVRLFGIFQDITERKNHERQLRFQASLLDAVGQTVVALDWDGRIMYLNRKARELYGWFGDEIVGKTIFELAFSSDNVPSVRQALNEVREGRLWEGEFRMKSAEPGKSILVRVLCHAYTDEHGLKPGFIAVAEDITESRKKEKELLRTQMLLDETNRIAKVGGWELNLRTHKAFCSDMTRKILGIPDDFRLLFDDDERDTIEGLQFYKEGPDREALFLDFKRAIEQGISFEREIQLATGTQHWVRIMVVPVMEHGQCIRLYGAVHDIQQIKESELRNLEQTRRTTEIVEGAKLCIWDWEVPTQKVTISERLFEISGFSRDELFPFNMETMKELLSGNPMHQVLDTINTCYEGGANSFDLELNLRHKLGFDIWVAVKGNVAERNSEGLPIRFQGIAQEITPRKKLEMQLDKMLYKYQSVFDLSPVGISIHEFDTGDFVEANEAMLRLSGYSRSEVLHIRLKDITPEKHLQREAEKKHQLRTTGVYGPYEKEIIRKDGGMVPVIVNCVRFVDPSGKEFFVTLNQDITIQNELIREIGIEKERSYRDAQYYKSLLENNSYFLIKIDIHGNYTFVNPFFSETFGYSLEESIGRSSMESVYPADQEKCLATFMQCFENPSQSQNVILRKITADGRVLSNQWEFIMQTNEQGEPKEVVCIGHDITTLIEKQEELQGLVDVTTAQNGRLTQFAHIVSHNLRSHVANLKSILDLTVSDDPDDLRQSWDLLGNITASLDETLRNLNEVISIQTSHNLPYKKVFLSEHWELAKKAVDPFIQQHHIEIHEEWQCNPEINVVPAYLDSILINLLSNAIKYRHPDRPLQLIATLKAENHMLYFSLQDNGLGIDLNKYRDKMFGLYKTFHNNKDAKGLGLFITKAQIEAMHGKIDVESTVNEGSIFTICLPYED